MAQSPKNLRIHFYGVQGSGAVFPLKEERDDIRLHSDLDLLKKVFERIEAETDETGALNCSVENLIGGPINSESLRQFRDQVFAPV